MNYVVWRRQPDNYVASSTYKPEGWSHTDEQGNRVSISFDILGETNDWHGVALPLILAERAKP